MSTITITFGDRAENHIGMQLIGTAAKSGFSVAQLREWEKLILNSEFINLSRDGLPEAGLLILRQGVNFLIPDQMEKLHSELQNLEVDKKAKMWGKVVNKIARHNLCFSDVAQEPNYEAGQFRS